MKKEASNADAQAVCQAAREWNRQVFIATHSPVLISQFQPADVILAEAGEDRSTTLRRVSDIGQLQELIEHYSIGSLLLCRLTGG